MSWARVFFGPRYLVRVRVYIGQGASIMSFPHEVYVRAETKERAKVKALKVYTPGLGREVISVTFVGD